MATGYRVPTGRANQVMEGRRVGVLFEDNTILNLTLAPNVTVEDALEQMNNARWRQGMPYIEVPAGLGRL